MKRILFASILISILASCSSLKTGNTTLNYDDAYFTPSQIDKKGSIYAKTDPNMFDNASMQAGNSRNTRSYGQSYSDRFRNFGSSPVTPAYTPALSYNPYSGRMMMTPGFYNPYGMRGYGYNPYMGYGYNPYGSMYYDPYTGYNPYYNSQWCYWNQYYSPYNSGYWGGSGTGVSSGSGSSWATGNSNGTRHSYNNTGTQRRTYNSTLPSSSQSSRSGWSSGSGSSSSSGSGSGYTRPSSSSSSSSSSSGGGYTRPSSSGSSGATGGSQSGSNTRRR